ncbi:hypothetical protein ANN_04745 [Periplaneta americana]|uniref:Uncharacterized protein n=1 Tax=Periplaneta americana TaxID=6978 RepID=A0ABQ8T998_PERAM|nr:hypothetical protein ANN_04745 [Periplaneta americana]
MDVTKSLFYDIRANYLNVWTRQDRQTDRQDKLPDEVTEWYPSGRRKRGRPKLTWLQGIGGIARTQEFAAGMSPGKREVGGTILGGTTAASGGPCRRKGKNGNMRVL